MRLACECPCATAKFLDVLSDHTRQRYGESVGKSMNAVELASSQRVVAVTSPFHHQPLGQTFTRAAHTSKIQELNGFTFLSSFWQIAVTKGKDG